MSLFLHLSLCLFVSLPDFVHSSLLICLTDIVHSFLSHCLPVFLSMYLSLFMRLSVLLIWLRHYLCVCVDRSICVPVPSLYLSKMFVQMCACIDVYLSLFLFVFLSICVTVCLCLYLPVQYTGPVATSVRALASSHAPLHVVRFPKGAELRDLTLGLARSMRGDPEWRGVHQMDERW